MIVLFFYGKSFRKMGRLNVTWCLLSYVGYYGKSETNEFFSILMVMRSFECFAISICNNARCDVTRGSRILHSRGQSPSVSWMKIQTMDWQSMVSFEIHMEIRYMALEYSLGVDPELILKFEQFYMG